MLRIIGKQVERLNSYNGSQKVVFTVITSAVTVYVGTSYAILKQIVGAQPQGLPITSTAQVSLDVQGDLWWMASADGVLVDVLETGAL